jgi:hypothetical protein
MTDFVARFQLSEALYREAIAPTLFDTARSTDHEWAPCLQHFLFIDSTDILSNPDLRRRMKVIYSDRV